MGPMARIRTIGEAEATGTVKEFYEKLRRERGTVAKLYQALSLKPEAMEAGEDGNPTERCSVKSRKTRRWPSSSSGTTARRPSPAGNEASSTSP